MGNLKTSQVRVIALRRRLIDDGILHHVPFSEKDLQTLAVRLESEGSSFFKVTLPLLGKALDQGLVSGTFACPTNFSLKKDTRLPKLLLSVFRQIFDDSGILLKKPNPIAIRYLRTFLLLDSKLEYNFSKEQESECVKGFRDRMLALRRVRIPTSNPVLINAKRLIGIALSDLDLSDITPGHGPGAVADGKNRFERWDFSSWPLRANRDYPFYLFGVSSLDALKERSNIPFLRNSVTKICLVPKDFKGPRLISAESTATQYLQQGQMRKMMQYIKRHPLLRLSLRLDDQTFNQAKARSAVDNRYATVDLSNASDTVSVPLFWYLFSEVPVLRRQLMATRSQYASYKGMLYRIAAFAPMGSAVCFPVESIVFWALTMASVRLHHGGYATWRDVANEVSVFGDDIILPIDGCLETLLTTLQAVGCSPNMSKTCWKTPFRESCGKEYYNGLDVSIIRNRRYQYDATRKIANVPVLLNMQRKFYSLGMRKTAALLLDWAREICPIFEYHPQEAELEIFRQNLETLASEFGGDFQTHRAHDRFCCAFSDRCFIDKHLRIRWNRDFQRLECRLPVNFQRFQDWESGGYPRLLARLLSDQVERAPNRHRKVKMGWTYLPGYMGLTTPILV